VRRPPRAALEETRRRISINRPNGPIAMLREEINQALKDAMRAKDSRSTATLRLIVAALKDRDIAARSKGNTEGIDDTEILQMLQTMIKQRRESIEHYEQGGRLELAEQEREEIAIIERFMPQQLDESEMQKAIADVIGDIGAEGLKDMGKTMGALKERYAGQMDFGKASAIVKAQLS
jgi:uncharacterized protein YqeY